LKVCRNYLLLIKFILLLLLLLCAYFVLSIQSQDAKGGGLAVGLAPPPQIKIQTCYKKNVNNKPTTVIFTQHTLFLNHLCNEHGL